jgi:hypothetical protein
MAALSRCVAISLPLRRAACVDRTVELLGLMATVDFLPQPVGGCVQWSSASGLGGRRVSRIEAHLASDRRIVFNEAGIFRGFRRWMFN